MNPLYTVYNNSREWEERVVQRLSFPTRTSLVDHVYSVGKRIPEPVKKAAISRLDGFVELEIAAGRNTVPTVVDGRRLEFVYLDAASMLYFTLSIDDEMISHEVPYSLLELPSEYDLGIDIGAHFGTYSVLLGGLNDLELICFEPVERNRRILGTNLIHNGIEATVDDRVVAGATGEVAFYEGENVASNEHTLHPGNATYGASTREAVTISSIIDDAEADAVFVKIDAEGEEDGIVADMISCDADTVSGLVELHPDRLEGRADGVLERLTDAGFHVEAIPSVGNPLYKFMNDPARALERDALLRDEQLSGTHP